MKIGIMGAILEELSFFKREMHLEREVHLGGFSIHSPKVIRGTLATGDQFISNPAHHAALVFNEQSAHAVEMEGAAVAHKSVTSMKNHF